MINHAPTYFPKENIMDNQAFFEKPEVKKLRTSYLDKIEKEIRELEEYIRNSLNNEGKIKIDQDNYGTVHKMKGVGGTFQFPFITDVAVEILKIFTVEAKTASFTIDEEQGHAVLDFIEQMKSHVAGYKKEMGM